MLSHVSEERLPQDRGLAFGRAHRHAVRATVAAYERIFREANGLDAAAVRDFGGQVTAHVGGTWPEAAAEISGMAHGADVDQATLMAVNARTELLAGATPPECSVLGVLPERSGGDTLLAQNWDWHPDLADSLVVWTVKEPDGRWFSTLTEAGILAKIGLNSRGLGLCLNILGTSLDGGSGGTPVHVLMRLILHHCDDHADVETLLEQTEVTGSSCLTVGTPGGGPGALVSYELSPAGIARVPAEDGVLLHTNHFLSPPEGAEDLYLRDSPDTLARLEELDERVRHGPRAVDADAVKQALRSHAAGPLSVCCHDPANEAYADRQESLVSVLLTLEDLGFELTDGAPCRTAYEHLQVNAGWVGR